MKHSNLLLAFLILVFAGLIAPQGTSAQPGALDTSFIPGAGASLAVYTVSLQSDGKILIGGAFITYDGTARNHIARVNADGSLDHTFDPGTGANFYITTTALQSDGKIVIGGPFTGYNGAGRNRIARLHADGTLDAAFDPGMGANNDVWAIALQSDGKTIIGGQFTSYNGATRNHIARLHADGTLDAAFNPGNGANNYITTTALQSDDKVIIGGQFTWYNGAGRNRIARLHTDGSLDASFDPGTGANGIVRAIAVQSDGKIIIGGDFTSYNGVPRKRIARLHADGTLDAAFDPGTGAGMTVLATVLQNDGKIIIVGEFFTYNGAARSHIARINADGSLDHTFDPGSGAHSSVDIQSVQATALQSDGKIIIVGAFNGYNLIPRRNIARVIGDHVYGVGIQGVDATEIALRLFPNPTDGQFTIKGSRADYTIDVHNSLGQLLLSQRAMQQRTQLDLRQQPNGIYHVSVRADGEVSWFKVVKQ